MSENLPNCSRTGKGPALTSHRAKQLGLYAAGAIGICAVIWVLVDIRFIEFNQAVTLGKTEGADRYFVFDPSNTSTRDGYVLMDVVLSFRTPHPNTEDSTKPYKSIKALYAFDCRSHTLGIIQQAMYPDEAARGEMIIGETPTPLDNVEFTPTVPGKAGDQMLRIACSHISRPRIWWGLLRLAIGAKPDSMENQAP